MFSTKHSQTKNFRGPLSTKATLYWELLQALCICVCNMCICDAAPVYHICTKQFFFFVVLHIATNIFSLAAMSQPLCVVNLKCICLCQMHLWCTTNFSFDAIQNLLNKSFNRKQHLYLGLLHKRYWMVPSRDILVCKLLHFYCPNKFLNVNAEFIT